MYVLRDDIIEELMELVNEYRQKGLDAGTNGPKDMANYNAASLYFSFAYSFATIIYYYQQRDKEKVKEIVNDLGTIEYSKVPFEIFRWIQVEE